MLENRRHFRLREFLGVTWKVEGQQDSGEGTIVNISSSGLLLLTDRVFRPTDDCILSIESGEYNLPFAGIKGRMVWFQHIYEPKECFLCGVQFLIDRVDRNFQQWLEMKVSRLSEAGDAKILGNFAF